MKARTINECRIVMWATLIILFSFCINTYAVEINDDYVFEKYRDVNRSSRQSVNTATLTTGTGEGSLTVTVTPYGSFGSYSDGGNADYWPMGYAEPDSTVFESAVYFSPFGFLHSGGIDGPALSGTDNFISVTDTEAVSEFDVEGFTILLTQTVLRSDSGSILEQKYRVTNNTGQYQEFEMIRHVDGDLDFDGSIWDSAGVRESGDIIYEFDSGDDPQNPSTFFGIETIGGNKIGYRLAAFRFTDSILSMGSNVLTNTIDGDNDGDGFVDSAYDVTLSQGSSYASHPSDTKNFLTRTIWGEGAAEATLQIERIALVQALENVDESSEDDLNQYLIGDKDTAVRVYVNTGVNGIPRSILGKLYIDDVEISNAVRYPNEDCNGDCYSARPKDTYSFENIFSRKPTDSNSEPFKNFERVKKGYNTLNFFLKDDLAPSVGTHNVKVEILDKNDPSSVLAEDEVDVEFNDSKEMLFVIVPIALKNPDTNVHSHQPDQSNFPRVTRFVKSVYPISEENVSHIVIPGIFFESADTTISEDTPEDERLTLAKKVNRWAKTYLLLRDISTDNVYITGIVHEDVCLYNSCRVGGYTYPSHYPPTTIQKERFNGNFTVDQVVAHEFGHTFGLGDSYSVGCTISFGDSSCNKPEEDDANPKAQSLTGIVNATNDDRSAMIDNTKNFIDKEIHAEMPVYNLTTSMEWDIESVDTNQISTALAETWRIGDEYKIQYEGDNHGKWLKFSAGGFNMSYDNGAVTSGIPVFYSWDAPWYAYMSNYSLSSESGTWTEPNEYKHLFSRLTSDAIRRNSARQAVSSLITIEGVLHKNDTIDVDPFTFLTGSQTIDDPTGDQYAIVFFDENSIELKRISFNVEWTMENMSGVIELDSVPFSYTTVYPETTNTIKIFKLPDTELFSRTASDSDPVIELTYPNGGENFNGLETITFSAQPNPEELYYSFYYSNDGGQTYFLIGSNELGIDEYPIDFSSLPTGAQCNIKVVCSNGYNYGEDTNDAPFSVGNTAPSVQIVSPSNDSVFYAGDHITLSGSAYDIDDGTLTDDNLEWSSNIQGVLGSGESLSIVLDEGTHEITLTATDANDVSASTDPIFIRIVDRAQAPVANAGSDIDTYSGVQVTLDGALSNDPNLDELTYLWSQLSGPTVALDNSDISTPSFTAPTVDEETYIEFQLDVSDGVNDGIPDTTLVRVSPAMDSDGDGTPDPLDGCPSDSNKTDPGICGCGVPDTDSDSDGTPDCNDGCPNDPYKTEPGICGCGVPDTDIDNDGTPDCNDPCPNDPYNTCNDIDYDTDGDGTPDSMDGCYNDPNKIDPGVCGCGVADTDTDEDGTPDCNDNCPNDPNKTEPGVCGCGVADTDTDADDTPDCNDNCPNDPNKTEPGVCGCGVADTDTDEDGTLDCNDNCPNDPNKTEPGVCGCGTADTDSDEDGVPVCNEGEDDGEEGEDDGEEGEDDGEEGEDDGEEGEDDGEEGEDDGGGGDSSTCFIGTLME